MAALAALLASTNAAQAEEPWALFQLGAGYISGPYQFEGDTRPLSGEPSQHVELEADFSSVALEASGVLGVSFPVGLAVGVGGDITLIHNVDTRVKSARFTTGYLGAVSLVGGWHPSDSGFSLRIGVGAARVGFLAGSKDDADDSVVDAGAVTGPIGSLGVGWVWGGAGVGVRVAYASLSNDHASYQPLLVSVGALFDFW